MRTKVHYLNGFEKEVSGVSTYIYLHIHTYLRVKHLLQPNVTETQLSKPNSLIFVSKCFVIRILICKNAVCSEDKQYLLTISPLFSSVMCANYIE